MSRSSEGSDFGWAIIIIFFLAFLGSQFDVKRPSNYAKEPPPVRKVIDFQLYGEKAIEYWDRYKRRVNKRITLKKIVQNATAVAAGLVVAQAVVNEVNAHIKRFVDQGVRFESRIFYFELYYPLEVLNRAHRKCNSGKVKALRFAYKYRKYRQKARWIIARIVRVPNLTRSQLDALVANAGRFIGVCNTITHTRKLFYRLHDRSLKPGQYSTDPDIQAYFEKRLARAYKKFADMEQKFNEDYLKKEFREALEVQGNEIPDSYKVFELLTIDKKAKWWKIRRSLRHLCKDKKFVCDTDGCMSYDSCYKTYLGEAKDFRGRLDYANFLIKYGRKIFEKRPYQEHWAIREFQKKARLRITGTYTREVYLALGRFD